MVEPAASSASGPWRVIYFGSPVFAVPPLRAFAADERFAVALVVTQGAKGPSPVETAARELDLRIYKPDTLRDAASRAPLEAAAADLFVVAAFGLIFGRRSLDIPRLGAVNIHPSLLPRYRGASPIAAAIAAGDRESGVSLMVMDTGIDTGAVVSREHVPVEADDTTESLGARLAESGAAQAVRDVPRWIAGELRAEPQGETGASLTRMLSKADGWLDWKRPAVELERQVRAMWPWPRAWSTVDGAPLQVHAARVQDDQAAEATPGAVIADRKRIVVATGAGGLELVTVEPAGRRAMSAAAYLNGRRAPLLSLGERDAPPPQPPLVRPAEAEQQG
jgi:methionyl-tRNA formyltransferase